MPIFGVFGTTWYYRLDLPGVKEFVAAYQKQFPGMAIKVPGNVYHNGYMATRELLRCVEEAGTTNNIAVIKKLEGRKMTRGATGCSTTTPGWTRSRTSASRPSTWRATTTSRPRRTTSSRSSRRSIPKEVVDTDAAGACKLESYEATPSYEVDAEPGWTAMDA